MKCPICEFGELEAGIKICPNCNSDLDFLSQISESERIVKKKNNYIAVLSVFLVIAILAAAYVTHRAKKAVAFRNDKITLLLQENKAFSDALLLWEEQKNKKNIAQEEIHEITEDISENDIPEEYVTEDEASYITYTVKPLDNLWSIAEKFYNDGHKFMKIVNDNQIKNPNEIKTGSQLKIFK